MGIARSAARELSFLRASGNGLTERSFLSTMVPNGLAYCINECRMKSMTLAGPKSNSSEPLSKLNVAALTRTRHLPLRVSVQPRLLSLFSFDLVM